MNKSSVSTTNKSRAYIPVLVSLILLGFFLRVWRLDAMPLRGDEGFTMVVWMGDIRETFGSLATIDPQPPFAILSIYGWVQAVGETEFAARFLSALAGTLTIAALYGLGRRLGGVKAGLLAAFLWAINPYQIWFAQDLRSGALWVALSALSTLAFLRAINRPHVKKRWALYVFLSALSLYTFYLELFVLAVHGLYALYRIIFRRQRDLFRPWLVSMLVLILALVPWFLQPRLYAGDYAPTAGAVNLPWAFQSFIFGETLPAPFQAMPQSPELGGWAAWLAIGLVVISLVLLWLYTAQDTAFLVTIYALLPLLMLSVVEWVLSRGYYRPRYVLSSAPGWMLLLAVGLATLFKKLPRQKLGKIAAAGLAAVIAGLNVAGIYHYQFVPAFAKAPDWRALAALFDAQVAPDDLIIRNYPDPTFFYYYRGDADVTLLPVPEKNTAAELAALSEMYDRIWFVPQQSDAWDADEVVLTWLHENLQLISDQTAGPFRLQQYGAYEASAPSADTELKVQYGDFVRLVGYTVLPSTENNLRPGDTLSIELVWEPLAQADADLTVFMHLLGPPQADGSPWWAGADHPPQHGHTSTSSWSTGVFLRDPYTLSIPENAPAGHYEVSVGFYNPADGERILDVVPHDALNGPGSVQLFEFDVTVDN